MTANEHDDDATVVRPQRAAVDPDATVVLTTRASRSDAAADEVSAEVDPESAVDPEATVVRPQRVIDEDATVVRPQRSIDEDATVVRASAAPLTGPATRLPPPPPPAQPQDPEPASAPAPEVAPVPTSAQAPLPTPAPETLLQALNEPRAVDHRGDPVPEPVLEAPSIGASGAPGASAASVATGAPGLPTRPVSDLPRVYGPRPIAVEQQPELVDNPSGGVAAAHPRAQLPSIARRSQRARVITLAGYAAAVCVSVAGLWVIATLAFAA
ncbi:hypothetical protein JOF28_001347 [Leucobacter exalbidus]|uniref:Uncharacterized protein n=1 Tax=Leucobacter exalbidus TaxID=662960 RepID=A0A940T0Q3_9MICO|nr:hypothetical protein [Leucobacter exalbidus]MBP1326115.1 hypothetical protein [Leucobacter exalbidus]